MSTTESGKTGEVSGDELGAAGSHLSTAPQEDRGPTLPRLGVIGWIRWFWRQLTSMRVALILLFMLSLGAIPGSLIPQSGVDEMKVQTFKDAHTTVAPVYDKLGLFHVYSSVWFSAIYILLFISLIGCIVPRTWQFVGQLRGRAPGAPKRFSHLPASATGAPTPSRSRSARRLSRSSASAASAPTSPVTPSPPRRAICARPAT